jgi:hypothetical protein
MTTKWTEWDFDNPAHQQHRRRPRVEYLPPEPERDRRVVVEVRHRHDAGMTWLLVVIAFAVMLLWRPFGGLVLFALLGPTYFVAITATILILAVAAWRERRHGRPF